MHEDIISIVGEIDAIKERMRELSGDLKSYEGQLLERLVNAKMTSCLTINYSVLRRLLR